MKAQLSIVLPCRNEEEAIQAVILESQAAARKAGIKAEIIVSDSSQDSSVQRAGKHDVRIVQHNKKGYGQAIREGVAVSTAGIILYADADNTYSFSKLSEMLDRLGEDTIVLGSRMRGEIHPAAMPWPHRRIGTPMINILLKILFGISTSDSQSGMRLMHKKTYEKLNLKTDGMEFATEMLIKARHNNIRILEVPIEYRQRIGESKLNTYSDGYRHFKYILLQIPSWIYLGIATISMLGGGALLLAEAMQSQIQRGYTGIFLLASGVQVAFFAVYVKTFLSTRYQERQSWIEQMYRHLRIPHAAGAALVVSLLAAIAFSFSASISFALLMVAVQIIFNSLLIAELSLQ